MELVRIPTKELDKVWGLIEKDIKQALKNTKDNNKRPLGVICKTIKGKGIDFAEGKLDWHHKANLKDKVLKQIDNELNTYLK